MVPSRSSPTTTWIGLPEYPTELTRSEFRKAYPASSSPLNIGAAGGSPSMSPSRVAPSMISAGAKVSRYSERRLCARASEIPRASTTTTSRAIEVRASIDWAPRRNHPVVAGIGPECAEPWMQADEDENEILRNTLGSSGGGRGGGAGGGATLSRIGGGDEESWKHRTGGNLRTTRSRGSRSSPNAPGMGRFRRRRNDHRRRLAAHRPGSEWRRGRAARSVYADAVPRPQHRGSQRGTCLRLFLGGGSGRRGPRGSGTRGAARP